MYTKESRPGKFEGNESQLVATVLHNAAGNGYCFLEIGSVDALGWYGLILGRKRVFLVHEDNYGFFEYETFASLADAGAVWSDIALAYERFYEEAA